MPLAAIKPSRMVRTCKRAGCRKTFTRKGKRGNPGIFCSKACRRAANRAYLVEYQRKVKSGQHVPTPQPLPPSYYGASFEEIAEELGVSSGRVQQIHHRALSKLRKRLALLFSRDLRRLGDADLVSFLFR